jgi:predicted short-subunit dehydrogenase-like oxidoreductase (DUF2520 family)
MSPVPPDLWVIGAGRLGVALGAALADRDAVGSLAYSGRGGDPPDHPLFRSARAAYDPGLRPPERLHGIVLAVPDDSLEEVAADLRDRAVVPGVPVIHLSGARGAEVLDGLQRAGHPVGSLHPLVSVPDASTGAARLPGAWYAVEGDEPARAFARGLVDSLDGRILDIPDGQKPLYHAAGVFASNYVVAVLAQAEALLRRAGVEEDARDALCDLARGVVENVRTLGPRDALTGPVARGDIRTVTLHLARLFQEERRLYSLLARHALELADPPRGAGGPFGDLERLLRDEGYERDG